MTKLTELTIKVPAAVAQEVRMLAEKMAGMACGMDDDCVEIDEANRCAAAAIRTMRNEGVIQAPRDYVWIMTLMNQHVLADFDGYFTGLSFVKFLRAIGVEDVPSKSTVYNHADVVEGKFPQWEYRDRPDRTEAIRRTNVAKRFVTAFRKEKSSVLEG